MGKTALLIGATGMVGEECLKELLASPAYDKVITLTRRALETQHLKLKNVVVDFNQLEKDQQEIGADDIFCATGTTIAKAGSQEAFRKVDFDLPFQVAQIAKRNGAKQFILVSSIGADSGSSIFYSRVKGELEGALAKLNFDALIIFRPSMLLGHRKEKRTGEAIGIFIAEKLSFLFVGPLKKYRGTPAGLLAKAMVEAAQQNKKGLSVIENDQII
ncbi:MAG: oxidoreductase [Bacteroidetes bacterium]|nr:oxidoreductase [Bacteroidota bacterium]